MNSGDLHKVWEIKALKRKPGAEDAHRMLERIAKQVQPIMRRHSWRVKVLSEFCPSNPSLLGLNVGGGVEVKLRLRRHNRDWDFFPFEQVLDTMLHELCHNKHGPHNAAFYKLWDELRKECEELVSKGVTGTGNGFDAPGRRLGGSSHAPPLPSLRKTALAAAEKRQRIGALLPSGPKTLGGNSDIMSALSPVQAAAMAAERRMYDDLWCASWLDGAINIEESGSNCSSSGEVNHASSEGNCLSATSDRKQRTRDLEAPGPSKRTRCDDDGMSFKHPKDEDQATWECNICTLINRQMAPICEACGTQKPKAPGCKYQTWSCKFCTLENSINLDKCSACDRWRYSYGPPVSTPGPNYGT